MYIPQVDEFVLYSVSTRNSEPPIMAQCVAVNCTQASISFQWGAKDRTKWVPFDKLTPADIPPAVDVEGEADDR